MRVKGLHRVVIATDLKTLMEKGSPSKEPRNRAQFFQEERKKEGEKKRKENRAQSSKAAPVLPLTEWLLIFFRLVKKKNYRGAGEGQRGACFVLQGVPERFLFMSPV